MAAHPWFPAEARRRDSSNHHGAWFSIPRELGERGDRCESAYALSVAGGAPAWHGPWPAVMELIGARDQGARRHVNAGNSVEKNAGRVGELTSATKTARTARFGPLARGRSQRRSGDGLLRAASGSRGKGARNGEKKGGSGSGTPHMRPRCGAWGKSWEKEGAVAGGGR